MILYLLISLGTIAVDQLVKHWAAVSLQPVSSIPVIKDVFHLTYCQNTGVAFGMFKDSLWLVVILTVFAVGALIYLIYSNYFPTKMSKMAVAFILGGAIGNFIDRLRLGFVVDLFDFRLINFPVFNVADIAITCGVLLLIIYLLTTKDDIEKVMEQNAVDQSVNEKEEATKADDSVDQSVNDDADNT